MTTISEGRPVRFSYAQSETAKKIWLAQAGIQSSAGAEHASNKISLHCAVLEELIYEHFSTCKQKEVMQHNSVHVCEIDSALCSALDDPRCCWRTNV